MKKNLYKFLILILLPLTYYIIVSGFNKSTDASLISPPPAGGRNFVNCIFNSGPAKDEPWWIQQNIDRYGNDSTNEGLHFNTIHVYDAINEGTNHNQNGTDDYGLFETGLSTTQKGHIDALTELIDDKGLDFWYERCKISKLCYAQRLIYEVKDPQQGGLVNNGFCYQNTSGCYETEGVRTVLHLSPNPITNCPETDATPRYIAENIYENLQHGDLSVFNIQYADAGTWYLKPVMRIDSSIVDNYPEREVVKIEIFNYNGNKTHPPSPIKTVTIKAKHFGKLENGQYNYDGSYKDIYNFGPLEDKLEITGGDGTIHTPPQLNDGQIQDNWQQWATNCKTDFKVYWLGQVEVWFDKMTVDDEYANVLLSTNPFGNFDEKILDMTTPENFLYIVDIVKQKKFGYENTESINYILNVMYQKLRNQAIPITLK